MKTIHIKNSYLQILAICLLLGTQACKKVAEKDAFLRGIPSITTSATLIKTDGNYLPYTYPYIKSTKSTALPGDTITIVGYLGGLSANPVVKVGGITAPLFNKLQYDNKVAGTGETGKLDFMQLIITTTMGTGESVPVTVAINGRTINAPAIKIGQFTNIPSATDTALVVQQVAEWAPANTALYNGGNLWASGTVTQNGNIYFLNNLGVFRTSISGVTEQVLANGTGVTPQSGAAFNIFNIMGMTVDIDDKILYFSASTTEPGPDNSKYYFTRLCRMDLASKQITVLNRSVFQRLMSFYQRAANLTDVLYDPTLNYLPAQGSVSDVKMALTNLKLSVDGTLYAINNVYNTNITPKSTVNLPMFKDPAYYAQRDSINATTWYNSLKADGTVSSPMGSFIQIRGGNIKSLFRPNASRPVPGVLKNISVNYELGTDNRTLYQPVSLSIEKVTLDDLESQIILSDFSGIFNFSSQDGSSVTGLPNIPTVNLGAGGFGAGANNFPAYAVLSNNNVVLFPTTGLRLSVLGVDPAKNNAYVYAGTEKGLVPPTNLIVAGQDKSTGPAKWVNFVPKTGGSTFFIGFDRNNNIYFGKHYKTGTGAATKYDPLKIYIIKKP